MGVTTVSFRLPDDLLRVVDGLARKNRTTRTRIIVQSVALASGIIEESLNRAAARIKRRQTGNHDEPKRRSRNRSVG